VDEQPIRVGGQHPFATPPDRRSPARRLRGRLLAPVTVWTAGAPEGSGEPHERGGGGRPPPPPPREPPNPVPRSIGSVGPA
jgi:hypothetical protein